MVLQLQHITFGYTSYKPILKDLSLSLEQGQIYALMGSNGAGKTTLFNLINGFIKSQNGEILFSVGASGDAGTKITNLQPYKINRHGIGRTFQDLRLITKLTVKENIILAMHHNPTDNSFIAILPESLHHNTSNKLSERADEIIGQYFLGDVKNSMAGEISYGQQKLLSLACCVANGATLLLLDEAVAGIQPDYRNKIATLLKHLKEQGKTILLIEHNIDFIADVADKIFFLNEGKMYIFDTMEMLRKDKQVMEAYI